MYLFVAGADGEEELKGAVKRMSPKNSRQADNNKHS